MMFITGLISTTILVGMGVSHVLLSHRNQQRDQGWDEALERETAQAAKKVEIVRPTSVWLTVYARKHKEAQQSAEEARLMLYGTVQKARDEGLSVKEIASCSGLSGATIRRITSTQAQVNGEVPS